MTTKKDRLMKEAKATMGLGVGTMAGMGVLGAMGNVPGMPAEAVGAQRTASAGLALLPVGQLAKVGLVVADVDDSKTKTKKKTGNKYIDRII